MKIKFKYEIDDRSMNRTHLAGWLWLAAFAAALAAADLTKEEDLSDG